MSRQKSPWPQPHHEVFRRKSLFLLLTFSKFLSKSPSVMPSLPQAPIYKASRGPEPRFMANP
ncbi:unnamed protein product, partial [Prunus brigantina]